MVKTHKKSKHSDPATLEYFKHDNKDQLDAVFIPYVSKVMGTSFKMYEKSVCFKNKTEKRKFKGVRPVGYPDGAPITKTCVCFDSFHRLSKFSSEKPHVALIEGKIGRIDPSKLPKNVIPVPIDPSAETEYQFHCCMVIVDPEKKTVHVFNPWKQGYARSGTVTRVCDIRPRLVKDLVAKYRRYDKFHLSGDQVWTSDCRIKVAQFARKLGAKGKTGYQSAFEWVKI
jgi:hypothetical protein